MVTRAAGIAPLIFILGTSWTTNLSAHALLDSPEPRDQQDGYKDGTPCGVTRASSQPLTRYMPGQELSVEWLETVNHTGCFVVDFSAQGDQNFEILGRKSHSDPPPPEEPSRAAPRPWSLRVTLPTTSCDGCTLRLRQIMVADDLAGDACPPSTLEQGSVYTTCANVTLGGGGMAGAGGTATAGAGGTATAGAGGTVTAGAGGTATAGAGGTVTAGAGGAATAGTGGMATAGTGTGGSGSATAPAANDEGGCSFSMPSRAKTSLAATLLGSLGLLALCRACATRRP